MLLFVINII